MTNNLAYFLGLWVAEGSFEEAIGRVSLTCGDREVLNPFVQHGICGLKFKYRRKDQIILNSIEFMELMHFIGMPMCSAKFKFIPNWVFKGKKEWAECFIAGLFDGDGHVVSNNKAQRVGYTSSSKNLVVQLQKLLCNLGIISRVTFDHITPPTQRVKVSSIGHRLTIQGQEINKLRAHLSLRIKRKQNALNHYCFEGRNRSSRKDVIPHQSPLIDCLWKNRTKQRIRDGYLFSSPLSKYVSCVKTYKKGTGRNALNSFLNRMKNYILQTEENLNAYKSLKKNVESDIYWDEIVSIDVTK